MNTQPADGSATLPRQPVAQKTVFLLAVAALFAATVIFHLGATAKGWRIYREQHLGTALEYAKGKIDLLRPRVVGFTANDTPIPQELPLWQAMTAVLMKMFGPWYGWANVASLLFAVAAFWPVYQLAKTRAGERAAWWTLLFFVSQPLIFYLSGRGGTDGSCLTFTIWFVYFADLLIRTGKPVWIFPAALFGGVSAVTKMPFFFCAGVLCVLLLVFERRPLSRWIMVAVVGAISGAVFIAWTRHTDAMLARAEFPFVDLRVTAGADGGEFMRFWYFGDLKYRLNPANWLKGGWRFLTADLGSFALAGMLLWGWWRSGNRLGQCWMWAGVLTTLVFTHLVLHHQNYYLMFSPAVALLCGMAAERIESKLGSPKPTAAATTILVSAGVLLLCAIQGLIGMKVALEGDPYPSKISALIREHTTPQDKLLMQGGGWGGHLLFISDRRGLSIWNTEFLEKPENLARIRELGYTKLVMVTSSPLLAAVQQINPGQADVQRESYRQSLTKVAEPWPVVFQTEDILIKEIPPAPGSK